jgi:pantoate kinase
LMKSAGKNAKLRVEQQVDVPIGFGFGASAASALSAVLAAAAALDLRLSKEQTAMFAHDAEIIQRTGLGTVSAVYDGVGAGFVYEAGAPGVAKFRNVKVPAAIRIVTASLAPLKLGGLLSSKKKVAMVNRFGDDALRRVLAEPTLDRMAREGEVFTRKIGIINKDVASLIRVAKKAGATYASQNMVGGAMHAVVPARRAGAVAMALSSSPLRPRVDVLEIGEVKAGITSIAELSYPTVTSSLV